MSDDEKKGPSPEEMQRSLQEFFGKMGTNMNWAMPGMEVGGNGGRGAL